jgi:pilus assembly protein Flp/PilA
MTNLTTSVIAAAKRFVADEKGNDAVEYGLILGLVSLAIASVAGTVGTDLNGLFSKAGSSLTTATSAIP